ncbi:acylaminoacyl-peptidase [Sulfobacillus acidophilus TPY]|uniref:Acylaminoacyl-peptidase n=1 Tax=Sulfobacillus acidophilus (strain ATCC 700253 / DSM 10332 / NAL) TaxID=679936 RepID=G8TWN9_SULAD|nr:acylaminoacyl-peptidase [Sulfobacillus acidophilus TPY]AEW06028.1 acylaminoacyl-peptidase [Sulfobacillus acidophilus DSM 10332]
MGPEALWQIRTWGQLAFHPHEPWLFFTERWFDPATNRSCHRIMRGVFGGLEWQRIEPFTAGNSDTRPAVSPDGRWLAFISERSKSAALWIMPLQGGGEAWPLTDFEGAVKDFAWHPDSDRLAVVLHLEGGILRPGRDSDERSPAGRGMSDWHAYYTRDVRHITRQYYKLDGTGYFDRGRDQLVLVSRSRQEVTVITGGFDDFSSPVWDESGDTLYFFHRPSDHPHPLHPLINRIESWHRITGQRRVWTHNPGIFSRLGRSEDGRSLLFCAEDPADHGYGLTRLYRLDLASGAVENVSGMLDRSVGDESVTDMPAPEHMLPYGRSDRIWMPVSREGRVVLTEFSHDQATLLWDAPRVVYDFAVRGDFVALAVADQSHPSGIQLARLGQETGPTAWAPGVPEGEAILPRPVRAISADGTPLQGWILVPPSAGVKVPAILEIHGGPMAMYGERFMWEFQCLASRGFAVVYGNPRGSTGYGAAFCGAIKGHWGTRDYEDVLALLDTAVAETPGVDAHRLGVAGGSYGGFMVNWLISHTDRFRAAVTMRSVVNRLSAMGSSDLGFLRVPQYGTKPWWEEIEPYWQQSPLKYAGQIHTPVLIEHQMEDQRLPLEQGEQLYAALKYLGRTAELLLYPGESHGMSRQGKPWHRVHRMEAICRWCTRYLGSSSTMRT